MKYWMKFMDKSQEILSISDITFLGRDMNIPELKERFNNDFVKGTAQMVRISFLGNGVNAEFVAGFRDGSIVFCNTNSKEEFDVKRFSSELNVLERVLQADL